jgi:hypothetical protein
LLRILKFMASAVYYRCAYIDLDGCLLKRMRCPAELNLRGVYALLWWDKNLKPTPIIKSRLALLYVLRLLGIELHVWTNRAPYHETVTKQALGRHVWLFQHMHFLHGIKIETKVFGPIMDDQPAYLERGKCWGLLVEQR